MKEGLAWILWALVRGGVGEGTWPWSEPCGLGWDSLTPAVPSFQECSGSHLGKPLGGGGEWMERSAKDWKLRPLGGGGCLQEKVTEELGDSPQSMEIQILLVILPLNKAPC